MLRQNVMADSIEGNSQTDKMMARACVVDMEVAYFTDKSTPRRNGHNSSMIHSSSANDCLRLPCPTVCVDDIVHPRTLPRRPTDTCPQTDDPVEGASASDPIEMPGPSQDMYVKVCHDLPSQNTTYWLDGKGLSPLMGRPNSNSRQGSIVTMDESLSDLLPEVSRQEMESRATRSTCTPTQSVPQPPNYVPLSIGLLIVSPLCGVPCLVFALRAQRAHARGQEKLSRKNNDWAFILLITGLMFLALLLLIYLVWQMTSTLCLTLPSTATPIATGGMPSYRLYTKQRSKNGIDHLNHSQVTIMPQFKLHDAMFQRPVKLKHNTSDPPPGVP